MSLFIDDNVELFYNLDLSHSSKLYYLSKQMIKHIPDHYNLEATQILLYQYIMNETYEVHNFDQF